MGIYNQATKDTDSASGICIELTSHACDCTFPMLSYHGDVSGVILLNFKSVRCLRYIEENCIKSVLIGKNDIQGNYTYGTYSLHSGP